MGFLVVFSYVRCMKSKAPKRKPKNQYYFRPVLEPKHSAIHTPLDTKFFHRGGGFGDKRPDVSEPLVYYFLYLPFSVVVDEHSPS